MSDEEVDAVMGEKNELAGTLPRKLQQKQAGGQSNAKATAEVIEGAKTAQTSQPTQPGVVAPSVGGVPKKIKKR